MVESLTSKPDALEMELFWEKHKRRIAIGCILLGIVGVGVAALFLRNYHINQASGALLSRASSMEQLQGVISKYPASKAAASALLLLAAQQRRVGNLEESNSAYQKFLIKFPKHPLVAGAALGLVENILVANRVAEAIASLQSLVAKYPASYVAPFVLYTQADILAAQPGQASEAKKQLQNLRQQYPDSVSARYSTNLFVL